MTRPAETSSLEELARAGDRAARAELLERSRADVVRFCCRYVGNVDEAEDATQDVFASLVEADTWPQRSLRAWLLRASRNHCVDLCRRRKDGRIGVGVFMGDSALPSSRTGPSTAFVRKEREEELRLLLATLAPAHAEVLMLRYFEDLARKEIAEVLQLPESVVKSRLFEGRLELRKKMGEQTG